MTQEFKILNSNNRKCLYIESDRLQACIDYYIKHNLTNIAISPDYGFKENSLEAIRLFPDVKGLTICEKITELSDIHSLTAIERLVILGTPKKPIDFTAFKQLHTFRGKWSNKIAGISESKSLKNLALWSYKSKSKNLFELSNLKQLQYLELVSTHIESLDGIEQFTNLGELNLHYLSKLNDISAIAALDKHLTRVKFENCKKIASYQPLAKCLALERLSMEKSANIQSLDFVQQLKKLKSVFWVRTKLAGDPNVVLEADHIERAVGTHAKFIKGTYESV